MTSRRKSLLPESLLGGRYFKIQRHPSGHWERAEGHLRLSSHTRGRDRRKAVETEKPCFSLALSLLMSLVVCSPLQADLLWSFESLIHPSTGVQV